MRKFTAHDIVDFEVEITDQDGHDFYGFITKAFSKLDGSELTDAELDWLNDYGNVDDIVYEAGQEKLIMEGDAAYDAWKESQG